ncbi:MAG TPA: hypothetical protein VIU62_15000 [Chloroflexota bacterium]
MNVSQKEIAEIQADQAHYHRDVMYVQDHYDELMDKYPEQWVAVYGETVVGVHADLELLVKRLRLQGVPPEHTVTEFLTREEVVWII